VERSVTVWFDELQMKVGQSIRQEIEAGIAGCRFGVVIVSPHFFAKQWTQAELDALFGKRMDQGQNLVLPIWHHVSKDEVSQHSPLLAGVFALNTAVSTVDEIADSLVEVVRADS
jgi:TIR domain